MRGVGGMGKSRIEAFSDGVIAIIITIMVLELRVPHGDSIEALIPLYPIFLSYVLSFIYVGIYWNNHHHMFHFVAKVDGAVLWLNLHLLFWLSLVPFSTSFVGENHFSALPVALYGGNLFMTGTAYWLLARHLKRHHEPDSPLAQAIGNDIKGTLSMLVYAAGIPLAFLFPWLSMALYASVAALWFVPDRRFERLA